MPKRKAESSALDPRPRDSQKQERLTQFLAEFPYMDMHVTTLRSRTIEQLDALTATLRAVQAQMDEVSAAS